MFPFTEITVPVIGSTWPLFRESSPTCRRRQRHLAPWERNAGGLNSSFEQVLDRLLVDKLEPIGLARPGFGRLDSEWVRHSYIYSSFSI